MIARDIKTTKKMDEDPDFIFPKLPEFQKQFYELNMKQTAKDIINSVKTDNLISQSVNNIDELNRTINLLGKRLREWFGLYFPELNSQINDNEIYAKLVLDKNKEQLSKKYGVKSVGADLDKADVTQIKVLATEITLLVKLREKQKLYIEKLMAKLCPNTTEVATAQIGAELIAHAGSLENLAEMTSSTIQLLGAEKALFRHLKNKRSSCPKHGIIINHPIVASSRQKDHGKAARHLASAISMAAKVDYFHEKGKPNKDYGKKLMAKVKKQLK